MALDESTANPVLMKELGVQGFPSYFVVDSTGRITQGTGVAQRPDNLVMALVKRM
jgi:protein-disulfide isomerase-like protein with CxxC motif